MTSRRLFVSASQASSSPGSVTPRARWLLPLVALLALLIPAALSACGGGGGGGESGGTLVFGTPVSLTGSTSSEGNDTLNGYKIWADTVNANGGITVGGKTYKVQIKPYDDGSNPTKSAQLMQQLITTDKVNFILGPYGTSSTLQDAAIAEQNQVPMVEGNGAAKSIFSKGYKYTFGVLSPASKYAQTMLDAAHALPTPPQTVAIIYANDAFSKEVAAAAKEYAPTLGFNVVFYQEYPNAATDLTNVLTPLKTSANGGIPDMIIGSGHKDEAVVTMKQAKQLGINAKLYGFTVGPALPDFITALGSDANYVMGSSQWTAQVQYNGTDVFKTAKTYADKYKAKYGKVPSYQAADGTACGLAFQFALEKAGSTDPQKVRDALASLDVTTFYGQLKFDSTGANTFKPMVTIQIQNGVVNTVFPANIANAQMQYPTPNFGSR
jgi:branched-chain amino acid transport system substrate-binding protein